MVSFFSHNGAVGAIHTTGDADSCNRLGQAGAAGSAVRAERRVAGGALSGLNPGRNSADNRLSMTHVFQDEAFQALPSDSYLAAHALAGIFVSVHQHGKIAARNKNTAYVEAYEMFHQFCGDSSVVLKALPVEFVPDRNVNVQRIVTFFDKVWAELEPEVLARKVKTETAQARKAAHKRYLAITGKGFVYDLSESDLAQIQKLITHLHHQFQDSEEIEDAHRARLLERIESLSAEFQRKMTSFEGVWGYFMEASYAFAKIGEPAKDIRKTIREIVTIISIASSCAYGLPSSTQPPLHLTDLHEGEGI